MSDAVAHPSELSRKLLDSGTGLVLGHEAGHLFRIEALLCLLRDHPGGTRPGRTGAAPARGVARRPGAPLPAEDWNQGSNLAHGGVVPGGRGPRSRPRIGTVWSSPTPGAPAGMSQREDFESVLESQMVGLPELLGCLDTFGHLCT
jgi:hypothetical protein